MCIRDRFDVLTADSVEAACQTLSRRGRVDIAICDLQMDGADGLALIRHLAEHQLAAALVILSGAESCVIDSVGALARNLGLNVLGCIEKPATSLVLHQLLRRYLEQDHGELPAAGPPQYPQLLSLTTAELAASQAVSYTHLTLPTN